MSNQIGTIEERAAIWMENNYPGIENWKLGEVKKVKRVTHNKEEGHAEALPDGLVIPILCASPGQPIAFYSEDPE